MSVEYRIETGRDKEMTGSGSIKEGPSSDDTHAIDSLARELFNSDRGLMLYPFIPPDAPIADRSSQSRKFVREEQPYSS